DAHGEVDPGDLLAGVDHLTHREALTRAEVVDPVGTRFGGLEGQHVGVGQIGDVDVVAHGGAVGGGVVGAEDRDVGPVAQGRLQHQRDQVGLDHPVLAGPAVGAGDVEVAQAHRAQAAGV